MVPYDGFLMMLLCASLQHTGATTEPPNKKQKTEPDCEMNWNTASPIILYESTHEIILPVQEAIGSKILKMKYGKEVTISCSKSSFNNPNLHTASISAKCEFNGQKNVMMYEKVQAGTIQVIQLSSMKDIACSKIPNSSQYIKDSIEDLYKTCASGNGKKIGIGFETYGPHFYTQIEVCYNEKEENAFWTKHTLHGNNLRASASGGGGSWSDDRLYETKVKDVYKSVNQQKLFISKLFKPVIAPQKYIARGHMSPNADFVTTAERRATFHYINALPQWQAGNNGNWKYVEERVRALAESRGIDLKIISGGHGVLKLDGKLKKQVPIYLGNYVDGKNKALPQDKVPVPELTWKIVINEATKQGIAFIVVNNPILEDAPAHICNVNEKDICEQLTWLGTFTHKERARLGSGYTYCCTVSALVSKINTNAIDIIPKQQQLTLLK